MSNFCKSKPSDSELLDIKIESADQVLNSEKSASSPSRKQLKMLKNLEFYVKHHKFGVPRKVLIDQSFCRYMLRHDITKEAICDLLLSKDVELNITSCSAGVLMPREIQNEEQQKALVRLALCLTELRCGHLDYCLKAGTYLLELPGVAVISSKRGGNLILKEASVSQKNFAEKNANECPRVVFENKEKKHLVMAELSSRKRKKDVDLSDESEMKGRRLKPKLQSKTEAEKHVDVADESEKEEGVIAFGKVKPKLQKKTAGVKPKLQKKTRAEKVPLDEKIGCKTLFLGNLSFSADKDKIEYFFRNVGRINDVRISQRKKKSAHFAHVEFLTAEAARQAMMTLNGRHLLGRAVRLDYAEKRPKEGDLFSSVAAREALKLNGRVGYGRGRHGGFW
nr:hypothetical protein [Tanacetum cinerariifolium]